MQILKGAVTVNSLPTIDPATFLTRFDSVTFGRETLQFATERLYIMLHKPAGVLSATSDPIHRTVLDLIDHPNKETLHLAGRLDRSSTGLVLLTNDGVWSESLTLPGRKVPKVYRVETDRPIPIEAPLHFQEGFYFPTEGIMTRPARLEFISENVARVVLEEGRYHQIKRMFHRLDGIRVKSLHREQIGAIILPPDLAPGEWRTLTEQEIAGISRR